VGSDGTDPYLGMAGQQAQQFSPGVATGTGYGNGNTHVVQHTAFYSLHPIFMHA
jgi:hypothetical protein